MFNFAEYGQSIENMMREWYNHTANVLQQSSDLGFAREHFVKNVLASFLPKSVIIGSGEIIDGEGKSSGQQDVIVYRADFPVLTSFTPVNTFLVEGVIATIEVKSNLSTGDPNHLLRAFKSVQKVRSLPKAAWFNKRQSHQDEIENLKKVHTVHTYIIGYNGWVNKKSLLKNYSAALEANGREFPQIVYQPDFCVFYDDGFMRVQNEDSVEVKRPHLALCTKYPFSLVLHHLLLAVLQSTGGLIAKAPNIETELQYALDPYFNFDPPLECENLRVDVQGNVVPVG